jgi:HPt (histidine-containing phosphotransfer) domain-containing protein
MTDSTSLDPTALARLRKWGGDKLAGQMVRLFLNNSGTRMDQIRSGAVGSDPAEAERGAHSLKSSAANVGAGAVVGLVSEIESAAASGEVEAVRTILPGLEGAYSQAIADLETIMDGIEATG